MEKYKAIGLMSGTSLDGVDIAACEFSLDKGNWSYKIHAAHTSPYSPEWHRRLAELHQADALTFARTHVEYGHYLGKLVSAFLRETGYSPDLIASHGHTIFHQPSIGFTCQVGSGTAIVAETGISVACEFRSLDVALGGQGAPLVPVGDKLLFGQYDACLNLGGFANISMESGSRRIAFDICPVNFVLNQLAAKLGLDFDPEGENARMGELDTRLLNKLNALAYYALPYPKSLGREWVESTLASLLSENKINIPSLLRTFTEHIACQANKVLDPRKSFKVLATGGGTHNIFLMERIRSLGNHQWTIPGRELADFKEAMVFAFLGVLRLTGRNNVLSSVTGSSSDHSGGALYTNKNLPIH